MTCVGEGFDDELACPICLDSWRSPEEVQPCGHIFCASCIRSTKQCPVCRAAITSKRQPNRALLNLALQVKVRCHTCGWRGTREESDGHVCRTGGGAKPQPRPTAPVSSSGNQGGGGGFGNKYSTHNNNNNSNSISHSGSAAMSMSNLFGPAATSQPPTPNNNNNSGPNNYNNNNYAQPSYNTTGPVHNYYYQQQQQQRPPTQPTTAAAAGQRRYAVITPSGPTPWRLYDLGQEEYDQVVSLFVFFDNDDSGELDRNEVGRLAKWLNFARTPQEVDRIFRDMDANGSGTLSLGEFLTWLRYNRPNPQALYGLTQSQYNTIMMQFHVYDRDQDGSLAANEFCDLMARQGDMLDPESAYALFRMIDRDCDGFISLHEFLLFRAGKH